MKSKINVALSNELRKKYGIRAMPLCRGDMVEFAGGTRKGEGGKVVVVDHKTGKVIIDGVSIAKSDGKQSEFPVDHSKLVITRIDGGRKERMEVLRMKTEARHLKFEEPAPIEPEKPAEEAAPLEGIPSGTATETVQDSKVTEEIHQEEGALPQEDTVEQAEDQTMDSEDAEEEGEANDQQD